MMDHLVNLMLRERRISNYDPPNNPGFTLLTGNWDLVRRQKAYEVLPSLVVTALRAERPHGRCMKNGNNRTSQGSVSRSPTT
jgi:hypothetical protein